MPPPLINNIVGFAICVLSAIVISIGRFHVLFECVWLMVLLVWLIKALPLN